MIRRAEVIAVLFFWPSIFEPENFNIAMKRLLTWDELHWVKPDFFRKATTPSNEVSRRN